MTTMASGRDVRDGTSARALRALTWRLIRRSALAIGLGMAVYVALEGLAFTTGYPDATSRRSLILWGEDPSIRMIAGPGIAVETVGGFIVWDAGLYFTLILGAWALTTTTRVLRGDEAAGRTDLMLLGPVDGARALRSQMAVLAAAALGVGACVTAGFLAAGAAIPGACIFGAWIACYVLLLMALAAVTSQLLDTRGAAVGTAGALLAVFVLVRMVANSAASREWLGWLTPTAWPDHIRAFDENRWPVLGLPLVVSLALVWAATLLRARRDTGAGVLSVRERHRSRMWGLGSPLAFAWRAGLPALTGWAAGIVATGLVVGAMLPSIDDFLKDDEGFVEILRAFGMDPSDLTRGFVGMWGLILGLILSVFVAFRIGAARTEEASGRADVLLTLPVARWRWLTAQALAAVGAVLTLEVLAVVSLWLPARASGTAITASDIASSMGNAMPVILVFLGVAVMLLGVAPRAAVALTAALAVATYVLQMVGPLLEWPEWLLNLSPFRHLANVPIAPVAWAAAGWLLLVALSGCALGLIAFERRDLEGA